MDTKKLRQKVLDLAIHGKLVKQDPNDKPASILLDRIRAEKARLVKEGKIKKSDLIEKPISEDEIPFEVPEGWEWCRINEYTKQITDFVASGSFESLRENVQYYNYKEYAILVRTKDFQTNFQKDLVYTDKHGYEFLSNSNLFGGEIIFPNIGASIGKVFIVPNLKERMTLAPNSIMARFYFEEQKDWFYYLFLSLFGISLLHSISSATAQGKFNKTDFKQLIIPIPPLAEQHRIVKAVDELFEQIDIIERSEKELEEAANKTRDKLLNLAIQGHLVPQDPNEEPASVLLERIRAEKARLVKEGKLKKKDLEEKPISPDEIPFDIPEGWVWCRLGDIFLHSSGKQLSGSNKEGTLHQYITTSNLYWGRFELDNLKSMYYKDSELEKCTAIKGDLLVCEGGDIGRSAIWPYDYDICLQNHVHRLRPFDKEYTKFVYYIMMLYKSLDMIGGRGIAIQGLSASALKSIIIPLPPLSEQRRIVSKLEELLHEIDKLKA